jgi:hypothetical protein
VAERKSKEQLAAEELDLAVRVLEKARARAEKTAKDADRARLALADAQRRHVFASESPYLEQNNQGIDATVHGADEDEAERARRAAALREKVDTSDDDALV